jgi:hypothetical protein
MTRVRLFSQKSVLKLFPELTPRQLIHWSEKEVITPYQSERAKGQSRIYSYHNLIEVAVALNLHSFGVPSLYMYRVTKGIPRDLDCILVVFLSPHGYEVRTVSTDVWPKTVDTTTALCAVNLHNLSLLVDYRLGNSLPRK